MLESLGEARCGAQSCSQPSVLFVKDFARSAPGEIQAADGASRIGRPDAEGKWQLVLVWVGFIQKETKRKTEAIWGALYPILNIVSQCSKGSVSKKLVRANGKQTWVVPRSPAKSLLCMV